MSVLTFFAVCAAAFLLGMLAGIISIHKIRSLPSINLEASGDIVQTSVLTRREYQNFLNYDGTEQI